MADRQELEDALTRAMEPFALEWAVDGLMDALDTVGAVDD